MNGSPTPGNKTNPKSLLPVAGILVAIAIVAALAVGVSRKRGEPIPTPLPPPPIEEAVGAVPGEASPEPDPQTEALGEVGSSSELADVEKDLAGTDVSGLDKELGDIQKELGL